MFIYLVCAHAHGQAKANVWPLGGHVQGQSSSSALSFLGVQTQVMRLDLKGPYLLSHFTGHAVTFNIFAAID